MTGSTVVIGWGLGPALLMLVVVGVEVAATARLGVGRDVLTAAPQRAAVSAVIVAVVRSLWLSAGFVALMLVSVGR